MKLAVFSKPPASSHLSGGVTPPNFCSCSSPFPEFPLPLFPLAACYSQFKAKTPPPGSLLGPCNCVSCPTLMYPQHLYLTHVWHIRMSYNCWLTSSLPPLPTYHSIKGIPEGLSSLYYSSEAHCPALSRPSIRICAIKGYDYKRSLSLMFKCCFYLLFQKSNISTWSKSQSLALLSLATHIPSPFHPVLLRFPPFHNISWR